MNIILYGLRGTGKTTIGKLLAEKMHKKFIDTDDVRLEKFRQTAEEVVENGGWPLFRAQEKEVILDIAKNFDNSIISTGGGAMMDEENVIALKKNGKTILLIANTKTMANRIYEERKKNNRPALTSNKNPEQEIEEIWDQRKDKYLNLADLIIDTSEEKNEEYIDKIIKFIKS